MSTPVPTIVSGGVSLVLGSKSSPDGTSLEQRSSAISLNFKSTFAPGFGAGQCDIQYSEIVSLSASTPVSILLSGDPTRKDAYGNQLAMARLKLILVRNLSVNEAAQLTIGGGSHSIFPAQEPIAGGGWMVISDFGSAGIVQILGGSADVLQLNPGSNAVSAQVVLLGASQ